MAIQVLNTDSDLTGKTLITQENAYTISGLHTFSRAPGAPFAVQSGSATVPNLIVGQLSTLPSGTLAAVSVPVGAVNTGLYSAAAGELDLAIAATLALQIKGTGQIFSPTQPMAMANAQTQVTVSSGSFLALTTTNSPWANVFNQGGISISQGSYTIATAGFYLVGATLGWATTSGTGDRMMRIMQNSTEIGRAMTPGDATINSVNGFVTLLNGAVNDTIHVEGFQNSGGNLQTAASAVVCTFWIVKLW